MIVDEITPSRLGCESVSTDHQGCSYSLPACSPAVRTDVRVPAACVISLFGLSKMYTRTQLTAVDSGILKLNLSETRMSIE